MEFKNDKQLKEKIKEVISMVTKIDYNTLTDNISLRNDLTVDSLQATQIITSLEEEYNVAFNRIDIFNIDTVLEITDLLKGYIKENKI